MDLTYYKRVWEETRGDEYSSWGTSVWYFAICKRSGITREQIEVYENGNACFYDEDTNLHDQYGGLSEIPFDLNEWKAYEISQLDYEHLKRTTTFINSKQGS
ncbi:hypothetical protein [Microbulbifer sp. GL-2]|uniref:hypothetical protein n=1 Tax=Microbulbifer sp. GL-2 TaxID=2591606 RepID=UPI0011656194|nr:hypothetical protein [Microbulbifer sp. GL-2]BBM02054.1 hypothetical protein GL2_21280 [Microbulbifer sp. GL-2]